jgi:hypothetical protein
MDRMFTATSAADGAGHAAVIQDDVDAKAGALRP